MEISPIYVDVTLIGKSTLFFFDIQTRASPSVTMITKSQMWVRKKKSAELLNIITLATFHTFQSPIYSIPLGPPHPRVPVLQK
jgi:hypothetical protein